MVNKNFLSIQTFVRDGNKKNAMKFLDIVIKEVDASTNLLFFPMNSGKDKNDKHGFHWTLLVLNVETRTWFHYNSAPPRGKKKNIYMEDAKQMVRVQI